MFIDLKKQMENVSKNIFPVGTLIFVSQLLESKLHLQFLLPFVSRQPSHFQAGPEKHHFSLKIPAAPGPPLYNPISIKIVKNEDSQMETRILVIKTSGLNS